MYHENIEKLKVEYVGSFGWNVTSTHLCGKQQKTKNLKVKFIVVSVCEDTHLISAQRPFKLVIKSNRPRQS